jgi:hypothetical protein
MHRALPPTHLALLLVSAGAHSKQAAQQEEVDLKLCEHVGQRAHLAQHLQAGSRGGRGSRRQGRV